MLISTIVTERVVLYTLISDQVFILAVVMFGTRTPFLESVVLAFGSKGNK